LTLRDVRLARGGRISLLGSSHQDLAWRMNGSDLVITTPVLADGELPFAGAHAFKIEGALGGNP
jgi:hypothetical protein